MALRLNPFVRVQQMGRTRVLFLMAPVRRRALSIHSIAYRDDPALYRLVSRLPLTRASGLSPAQVTRLASLGVLLEERDVPKPAPFTAYLEDLERFLARVGQRDVPAGSGPLTLNPHLTLEPRGRVPGAFRTAGVRAVAFPSGVPMLWVRNPRTLGVFPYHLGPRYLKTMRRLLDTVDAPDDLNAATRSVLQAAGILIPSRRVHEATASPDDFRAAGATVLAQVFDPFQADRLARYLLNQKREGFFARKDHQSGRWFTHHEPLCAFFHQQLGALVSKVGRRRYYPVLTYPVVYRAGDWLPAHRDSAPCDVALSIQIEHRGRPLGTWPLDVERADKAGAFRAYRTQDGDAVLFNGSTLLHKRAPLPKGERSINLVLCFSARPFTSPLRTR